MEMKDVKAGQIVIIDGIYNTKYKVASFDTKGSTVNLILFRDNLTPRVGVKCDRLTLIINAQSETDG